MIDWRHTGLFGHEETLNRIEDKLSVLNAARPLGVTALNKIQEVLSIEWTYNSNKIEGNTLTLRETQMVVEHGLTVKGKTLSEHFEAVNHQKAIKYLYQILDSNMGISSSDIISLHYRVMIGIDDDFAGRIRNGAVRINGANFIPPNAQKVSGLLDEVIEFINSNPEGLKPLQLAALLHHKFVWVHPFFDGNGRTVRLAMNLFLMRLGFPPAVILANDRAKYYAALNSANKGDYRKLMLLICQAAERSLNIYLSALPESEADFQPIPNIAMEPEVPYSQEYISLLARQGKIDAHKEGRNWFTTKQAVLDYIGNRQRNRILKTSE